MQLGQKYNPFSANIAAANGDVLAISPATPNQTIYLSKVIASLTVAVNFSIKVKTPAGATVATFGPFENTATLGLDFGGDLQASNGNSIYLSFSAATAGGVFVSWNTTP